MNPTPKSITPKKPTGSFYRHFPLSVWSDVRVRRLSKPQPNAESLLFRLRTGEHTTPVPGLCTVGAAALAEVLDWPLEGFHAAFAELQEQGLAMADWKARVVWVPDVILDNRPANPDMVAGWFPYLNMVPDCEVKQVAVEHLRAALEKLGPKYLQALTDRYKTPCGTPCPPPSSTPCRTQEEEVEVEKEEETPSRSADADVSEGLAGASDQQQGFPPESEWEAIYTATFERFWNLYPRKVGKAKALEAWKRLTNPEDPAHTENIMQAVERWSRSQEWLRESGRYVPHPEKWLNRRRWTESPLPDAPEAMDPKEQRRRDAEARSAGFRDHAHYIECLRRGVGSHDGDRSKA